MSAQDIYLSIGTFVFGLALSLFIGWLHLVVERRAIRNFEQQISHQSEARK